MSNIQKIIKYLAIAFALLLTFNIIEGIISVVFLISNIFDTKDIYDTNKLESIEITENIYNMDIDMMDVNIIVKKGDKFQAETNSKYIRSKQENNKLYLKEINHNWFNKKNRSDLVIYIPTNFTFDSISIETGTGKIKIEELVTKYLDFDLGAGLVTIDKLTVLNETKLEGGAGEVTVKNSNLNKLDLSMGVGKFNLTAVLSGDSKIEHGVGEFNLNLIGTKDDYRIKVNNGIGSCKIDGDTISNDIYYGNGKNLIDIDGGVGNININYEDNSNLSSKITKTFNLLNITQGQEKDSYYLTLQSFQGEVDTVLLSNLKDELIVGKTYEFYLEKNSNTNVEDNIKSIFDKYKIISIKETGKQGLEQTQDSIR